MLYILVGEDDFSLTRSLEEIKQGLGDQSLLMANTTVLNGQQVTLDQLRAVVETAPFLAEKRLAVVQGLLGRFEAGSKPRRRKKAASPVEKEAEYKSFADCLTKIPDCTVLVLVDGKIKGGNPLLKQLSSRAKVVSFPILKGDRLLQWIKRGVVEQGATISPEGWIYWLSWWGATCGL